MTQKFKDDLIQRIHSIEVETDVNIKGKEFPLMLNGSIVDTVFTNKERHHLYKHNWSYIKIPSYNDLAWMFLKAYFKIELSGDSQLEVDFKDLK